jgi:ribose 5-phosphate isomerase B
MVIYIGADHRGFELKNQLRNWLMEQGHKVVDCGNDHADAEDDFPDFARAVALKIVQSHQKDKPQEEDVDPGEELGITSTKSHMYEGVASMPNELDDEAPAEDHELGILVCGSGIGVCITANRYKGVRCRRVFYSKTLDFQ